MAQVMFADGWATGQATVGASEEKLIVPALPFHSVTDPPFATVRKTAFTAPVPIGPLTDAGAVAVALSANPLTSMRLTSASGSSMPTTVHVEKDPLDRSMTR